MSTSRLFGLLLTLSLLVLSGCAATPAKPKQIDIPAQSRLLIVSALGNTIKVGEKGTTVFQNWQYNEVHEGWDFDAQLVDMTSQYLEKGGLYTPVKIDPEFDIKSLGEARIGFLSSGSYFKDGSVSLKSLAEKYRCDGILVITPPLIFESVYTMNAYHISQHSVFGSQTNMLISSFRIVLHDKNGEELDQVRSYEYVSSPFDTLEKNARLTGTQWDTAKNTLEKLAKQGLQAGLKKFALQNGQISGPSAK